MKKLLGLTAMVVVLAIVATAVSIKADDPMVLVGNEFSNPGFLVFDNPVMTKCVRITEDDTTITITINKAFCERRG